MEGEMKGGRSGGRSGDGEGQRSKEREEMEGELTHLLRNSMYSVCLMRPVLIMMVWKHCRSIAHSFTLVRAGEREQEREVGSVTLLSLSGNNRYMDIETHKSTQTHRDICILWKTMLSHTSHTHCA